MHNAPYLGRERRCGSGFQTTTHVLMALIDYLFGPQSVDWNDENPILKVVGPFAEVLHRTT